MMPCGEAFLVRAFRFEASRDPDRKIEGRLVW